MPLLTSHLYAVLVLAAPLLYLATCDSNARICPLVSPLTSTGRPPATTLSNSSLVGDFRSRLPCSGSGFTVARGVRLGAGLPPGG